VHARTRSAFRDFCSDFAVVRQIERAFRDEGLDPDPDNDREWYRDGQRRGTFDRHTARTDWTDATDVRRVLNVFEHMLTWASEDATAYLRRHLERDGFIVDGSGRIRAGAASTLSTVPLENLTDPSAIYDHLQRLADASDRDPAGAISGAKALVEATTKVVLRELNTPYDEQGDVPTLVRTAQKALKLHPESLAPTAPGADIVKRILSNLSQIAIGLAELRNQYGPDHGRTTAVVGLRPRHAHLAIGAATTYCRLLLETLDDRRAVVDSDEG
jgi:hypothetical protein